LKKAIETAKSISITNKDKIDILIKKYEKYDFQMASAEIKNA
jgi:hypothetical protein